MDSTMPSSDAIDRSASPGKYTFAVVQAIKESLMLGSARRVAAENAGINRATFYEWLKDKRKTTFGYEMIIEDGSDGQPVTVALPSPVMTFREIVIQAEAAGTHRSIAIIAKAAQGAN